MREVTIRSGDAQGAIGLDLGYTDEQGPCLIKNVRIVGFDVGLSAKYAVDSITLEHVILENQRVVGLRNAGQCVSLRGLTSINAVPAVENTGVGVLVLLDSQLRSPAGTASGPAVVNEKPAALFARNVTITGYATAIGNTSGHGNCARPMPPVVLAAACYRCTSAENEVALSWTGKTLTMMDARCL